MTAHKGRAAARTATEDSPGAVHARSGPIHVLIHGAGGMPPADARTAEGADCGFAQNFLGACLLTRLLEERILVSAPARVIAVGAGAHRLLRTVNVDALMHPGEAPQRLTSGQWRPARGRLAWPAEPRRVTTGVAPAGTSGGRSQRRRSTGRERG